MAPPPPGGDILGSPRRFILPGLFVGGLFLMVLFRVPEEPTGPQIVSITGPTMGTTYTVKVVSDNPSEALATSWKKTIADTLETVNEELSTYRRDSELSRFNRSTVTAPQPASRALRELLTAARKISEDTGGAFDVTVGPVVNAWGFGPEGRQDAPSTATLEAARARVGYHMVTVDHQSKQIQKERPDLYVDLSAIAKGYGVDQVAKQLDALGLQSYLVEVGGELRAKGKNARGKDWRVGIEKPSTGEIGIREVVPLANLAMATSGDYRNYYEVNGRRISHTIDPRTGHPIEHRLASVTVLDNSCESADGWATALNVLGPEAGFDLAQRLGLAALFLIREPSGGFIEKATTGFAAVRVPRQDSVSP